MSQSCFSSSPSGSSVSTTRAGFRLVVSGTVVFCMVVFCMVVLIAQPSVVRGQSPILQPLAGQASGRIPLVQFAPETPAGLVQAAELAESLQRSADAREYLRTLLSMQPAEKDLQELRARFGIGVFLRLNANPDLQPEARTLLMAVNAASRQFAASDARLQELAQQLGANGPDASSAIVEILAAEDRAAAPLLALDPATAQGQLAQEILERHARIMRHGLLAAMATADPAGQQRIVRLLATTADPEIGLSLLRWQFGVDTPPEVRAAAAQAVDRLLSQRWVSVAVAGPPESAEAAVRRLCVEAREALKSVSPQFPETTLHGLAKPIPDLAHRSRGIALAADWAAAAVEISPEDATAQALVIVSQSAALSYDAVTPEPVAVDVTLDVLSLALEESLVVGIPQASGQILQTMSAAMEITESADRNLPRLLAAVRQALISPHVQVRLLASLFQLKHRLFELNDATALRTLVAVQNGKVLPEAVVIDPDSRRLPGLTAVLADSGYAAIGARTGIDGFEAAVGQLQCELVLVNCYCIRWDLTLTISNLRADARTRLCPIVVYGPETERPYVRSIAQRYPGVWFVAEPFGHLTTSEAAAIQRQLQGITLAEHPDDELSILERLRYAGVPEPRLPSEMRETLQQMAREL